MSEITKPIILDETGQAIVDAIESLSNRSNDEETFVSSDVVDSSATEWTAVTPLASGEKHSSIFAKVSQMFKNTRYLYNESESISDDIDSITQDIDELFSKIDTKNTSSYTYDLNTLDNGIHTYKADSTNIPVQSRGGTVLSLRNNYNSEGAQIAEVNGEIGFYYRNLVNSNWGTWFKLPTREEITVLNSKWIVSSTVDDLCSKVLALPNQTTALLYTSGAASQFITNGSANYACKGYVSKNHETIADIFILHGYDECYTIRFNPTAKTLIGSILLPKRSEIDTLNSKTTQTTINTPTDLNSILNSGNYAIGDVTLITNWPLGQSWGELIVHDSGIYVVQIAVAYDSSKIAVRVSTNHGTSWRDWVIQPTRAEFNTLNNNTYALTLGTKLTANTDFNSLTTVGNYYFDSGTPVTNGPEANVLGTVKVEHSVGHDDNYLMQTYRSARASDNVWVRRRNAGTWDNWVKQPARQEITVLNNTKTVIATFSNVSITDNADTTIDITSYLPTGYALRSVNALVETSSHGFYQLPWLDIPNSKALYVFSLTDTQVTLKNFGTGWNTCTVYLTLFYEKL